MIYNIHLSNYDRTNVIEFIRKNKKRGTFRVIDIGGSATSWSYPYVDCILDINALPSNDSNITFFQGDITHPSGWNEVIEYVSKYGKFDFCICSHTLEDIMNPKYVCEQINKIAHQGFIAFPSKYAELCRKLENPQYNYRGYIHHRWIFSIKDDIIYAFPKINYLDSTDKFDSIASSSRDTLELSFFWKNSVNIEYINNNYLGPSIDAVISYYDLLLDTFSI